MIFCSRAGPRTEATRKESMMIRDPCSSPDNSTARKVIGGGGVVSHQFDDSPTPIALAASVDFMSICCRAKRCTLLSGWIAAEAAAAAQLHSAILPSSSVVQFGVPLPGRYWVRIFASATAGFPTLCGTGTDMVRRSDLSAEATTVFRVQPPR